jgi:hypothetical protein
LLEKVQVLEVTLLVDEVVFQGGDRALHVQSSCLLTLKSRCTDRHEVTHNSLGCNHSQLFVSLLFTLDEDSEELAFPLYQLKALLLSKLKRCNLVVEDSHVLVHVLLALLEILSHVYLVAKRDTSEELDQHLFIGGVWAL